MANNKCCLCYKEETEPGEFFPRRNPADRNEIWYYCDVCKREVPKIRTEVMAKGGTRKVGNLRVDVFEAELRRVFKSFGLAIVASTCGHLFIDDYNEEEDGDEYRALDLQAKGAIPFSQPHHEV